MHNNQFFQSFMKRYDYPEIAVKTFTDIADKLDSDVEFGKEFDKIINDYMYPEAGDIHVPMARLSELGEKHGISEYSMHFMLLLFSAPILKERYEKAGIDESLFWDMCNDFKCKLLECIECHGIAGSFVCGWNDGWFRMTRFAYGRFQYELGTFMEEKPFKTSCGIVLKPGDTFVNFHIPSSGIPLTDEVRLESYIKAYPHFKDLFPDGKVIFGVHSWLLFRRHREFLPENLNILRFMDDFELVTDEVKESFGDIWRIFGRYYELPYDQLPEDTSLRKAYKQWLCAGNKTGAAFGCFVFDGEKIIK